MTTIVIDQAMREKMLSATGEVEFRDEAGEVLGTFLKKRTVNPNDDIDWPSDEEIERSLREDKRYTPDEVMAHLRKLEEGLK